MVEAHEKTALREQLRQLRQKRFTNEPFLHLLASSHLIQAKVIATYISYGFEPSTSELNAELLAINKTLLLPRISGDFLEWVQWNGDFEELQEHGNLLEPLGNAEEDLTIIDVIIVPALYVDADGFRLGQGGGYYDRTLATLNAWKVALVHQGEVGEDQIPRQPHDIPVDAVATSRNLKIFKK